VVSVLGCQVVQLQAGRLVQQGELLIVQEELELVPLQGFGLVLGTGLVDLLLLGACLAVSLSRYCLCGYRMLWKVKNSRSGNGQTCFQFMSIQIPAF
jgi:hypothetical protein